MLHTHIRKYASHALRFVRVLGLLDAGGLGLLDAGGNV